MNQIFKVMTYDNFQTSTVKHDCQHTALAAALRACSNNVGPDPVVLDRWKLYFRENIIPLFIGALDQEEIVVDFEKWLKRGTFPLGYQSKMRKALETANRKIGRIKRVYRAFPKIEQQFTTVPHSEKDTILNDVKERQICGPDDEKKCLANAFINELEGLAHRHLPQYCGRKNWEEICSGLEKDVGLNNSIWGAADGSGFDMTQLTVHNELLNELLVACAKHSNVTWCDPLTIDSFIEVIQNSLKLQVDVPGVCSYTTQGRASGDGWTTFGNTILMISYWMFTYHEAGISKYRLVVKGDDVLLEHNVSDQNVFLATVDKLFAKDKKVQDFGLGQICKKINFGDICDLDFLSCHFFRTDDGHLRMIRIPARVFQSNSWSTQLQALFKSGASISTVNKIRRQLCYSKGMNLLAWAEDLPIFGVLGRKMVELGEEGKHTEYNEYADKARKWTKGRSDRKACIKYMHDWYNMRESDVLDVERQIQDIHSLDGEVYIPQLSMFNLPFLSCSAAA
jgi:hypothetical protein